MLILHALRSNTPLLFEQNQTDTWISLFKQQNLIGIGNNVKSQIQKLMAHLVAFHAYDVRISTCFLVI